MRRDFGLSVVTLTLLSTFLFVGGCSNQDRQSAGSAPAAAGGQMVMKPSMSQDNDAAKSAVSGQAESKPQLAKLQTVADSQPDRYLIRNATLRVETKDPRRAMEKVTEAVKVARGYLSDMHETVDALGSRSISVTVRIPATGFDQSMLELQSLGKVLERQVTAEDVTEEFVDSQSRLRNLKKTEDRLLAHLTRTGKLADTLLVEKELARVRQEIEQIEGRLRFLSHRISYSTITLTLSEAARPLAMTPPEHYSTGRVTSDAVRSLIGFGQEVWSAAIWLAVWAVVWAPLVLAVYFALKKGRKMAAQSEWQPGPPVQP